MSESQKHNLPYKNLGSQLKRLREKLHESVAEVSGAVEIDPDMLLLIEKGERCPSEDVLLLLFSHLDTPEEEAVRLWELAGYDQEDMHPSSQLMAPDDANITKPLVMVMQPNNQIVYTDMVNITVNNYGVVMNFMQGQGIPGGQPAVVGRVGMSREHAESVLKVLQQTLQQTKVDPKSLPEPRKTTTED
jgi:transcriptional regulator with XRE-family HTH domain